MREFAVFRSNMGVCLSRCGDAHQKAGVVAATISHQNSLDNVSTDVNDPNHSLKKFLQFYEYAESKRSFSSPRASLGDTLQIPHSSELFSLPDSDVDRSSCCISPSPARTSRASFSSRATSSPKSTRNSFSVWGGRFSTDRTMSVGCRKKIRPARSSKLLQGDQEVAAHQRLVEAIARLERLNGGKNLELRGSSFCRSDLEKKPRVLPKSRSGEIKRPSYSGSGRHHIRLGRNLPQQPCPQLFKSTSYSKKRLDPSETSHCCSRTTDLVLTERARDPVTMLIPETFSQPKTMGNLKSLAAPIIKQMPLEKSVTNFLKEVENFVSLIEAPRLSLSSEAALRESLKDAHDHEPVIITTYSRSVEDKDDTDSDEQFTFFEASFQDPDSSRRVQESGAVVTSLQRLVQSATQEASTIEKPLYVVEESIALPVMDMAKNAAESRTSSPNPISVPESGDVEPEETPDVPTAKPTKVLSIYVDSGLESMRTGKAEVARPALTVIDTNVTLAAAKKSPITGKSPLRIKSPKVSRRGLSRSLDSRDQGAVAKVDFNIFRAGPTQVAPLLVSNASERPPQPAPEGVSRIEEKSLELGSLHVLNTSTREGKAEEESACGGKLAR